MAIVGEAHIIVRAITTSVPRDIKDSLRGVTGNVARTAGRQMSQSFAKGWNDSKGANIFTRITEGLRTLSPAAEMAADKFRGLTRASFTLGPILSTLVGGIGAVVASLGTLISVLAAAAPAALALVNVMLSMQVGARVFSFAMKGISGALSQTGRQSGGVAKSIQDLREEFQQLGFDAEGAALSQERAALNLESAREAYTKSLEFPENSRERREALLSFQEADLAYRQAKDRSQDLNKELAKGQEGLARASQAGGGADPFAGLTESQKTFAKFLVDKVLPEIENLREVVASKLLVPLIDDIDSLTGTWFPILETKLGNIGTALESTFGTIIQELLTEESVSEFSTALDDIAKNIKDLGPIFKNSIDIFSDLIVAAQPVTEKFLGFLGDKTQAFADKIDQMEKDGSLTKLFERAGEVAASLGTIFGNVFEGFGNIIEANFAEGGAGWKLLEWLETATAGFANIGADDPEGFQKYFNDVFANAQAIFSSIGALIGEIFKAADNPAIKETFDILKTGAPALGEIIDKNISAGPSLANLVVTITNIVNALTDSDQIKVFFDTLNSIAGVVETFFTSDIVQKVLNVVGPIFSFTLALGTAFQTAQFFGSAMNGIFQSAFGPIGTFVTKARQSFAFMTYSNSALTRSFGKLGSFLMKSPVLIAIGLLVGAFIYLYNSSDSFRQFVDTTLASTLQQLGDAFGRIMTAIQPLIDIFVGELLPTLINSLQPILEVLIAAVGSFAVFLGDVLVVAVEAIVPILMYLIENILMPAIDIFTGLITLVGEFAKALMTGDWGKFGEIFMDVLHKIVQGLVDLVTGAGNLIVDILNWTIREFFNGVGGGIADLINTFSGGTIDLKANPPQIPRIPKWTIPGFADGGVVYPTPGGVIARVAEAGRPERIEPLNSNGLSDRDLALIETLAPAAAAPGITLNVYPAPGMDVNEFTEAVSRKLAMQIKRGSI